MSTENTVQNSGERDVIAPRDSHQPIIAPRDSHQPIIGPGVTPQIRKPRDRDVVKPMDSHQPIAATDATVEDAPADEHEAAKGKAVTTEDSHQPVGAPK
ncbi:hypothetical protein ACFVFQ_09590 [Streptomyces sp. NPDC057743]|uniref:hypothetical protein n=1 Tax=Streptomyces sp. NPDC057743 TaxID=3346236 RepID=UPI0036A12753